MVTHAAALVDWLETQAVVSKGVNVWATRKPTFPKGTGPYMVAIDTGGGKPTLTQNGTSTTRPYVQLIFRGLSVADTTTFMWQVLDVLGGAVGLHNTEMGSEKIVTLSRSQEPIDLGLDEAGHIRFSVNLTIEKA